MTTLLLLLTFITQLTALVLLIILAGVCVEASLSKWLEIKDRNNWAQRVLGKKELADDIRRQSYWFSEDPKTMKALQILAAHVQGTDGGHIDIQRIRDQWRNANETNN